MQDPQTDRPVFSRNERDRRTSAYRGICEGAPVLTAQGMRSVDHLKRGDMVVTNTGLKALLAVHQLTRVTHAVYVLAGTQGHRCQHRDSLLPAGQPILLRDWRAKAWRGQPRAFVPIGELVDGEYLRALGQVPLTFYQLSFAHPVVLHADGLELPCATDHVQPGQVSYAPR